MNVLIVAKTSMQNACCVGGFCLDTRQNVRLLDRNGRNQPVDTPFDVGQVWDLRFEPRSDLKPPHVEDVLIFYGKQLQSIPDLALFLSLQVTAWVGPPTGLFDATLHFTSNGSGYVSHSGPIPTCSVGYWYPNRPLEQVEDAFGHTRYRYRSDADIPYYLKYVGRIRPVPILPMGTLIRVSLARWWKPDTFPDERCFLQLSGWYL